MTNTTNAKPIIVIQHHNVAALAPILIDGLRANNSGLKNADVISCKGYPEMGRKLKALFDRTGNKDRKILVLPSFTTFEPGNQRRVNFVRRKVEELGDNIKTTFVGLANLKPCSLPNASALAKLIKRMLSFGQHKIRSIPRIGLFLRSEDQVRKEAARLGRTYNRLLASAT